VIKLQTFSQSVVAIDRYCAC